MVIIIKEVRDRIGKEMDRYSSVTENILEENGRGQETLINKYYAEISSWGTHDCQKKTSKYG